MWGFRTVAMFEFIKGTLALIASSIIFGIGEPSVKNLVLRILSHLHPRATVLADLRILFWPALVYSFLRYIEAYGLWFGKKWGRAFAIFSTAIYLPFEFYEMYQDLTVLKALITILNFIVLLYLIYKKEKPLKTPISL